MKILSDKNQNKMFLLPFHYCQEITFTWGQWIPVKSDFLSTDIFYYRPLISIFCLCQYLLQLLKFCKRFTQVSKVVCSHPWKYVSCKENYDLCSKFSLCFHTVEGWLGYWWSFKQRQKNCDMYIYIYIFTRLVMIWHILHSFVQILKAQY